MAAISLNGKANINRSHGLNNLIASICGLFAIC